MLRAKTMYVMKEGSVTRNTIVLFTMLFIIWGCAEKIKLPDQKQKKEKGEWR